MFENITKEEIEKDLKKILLKKLYLLLDTEIGSYQMELIEDCIRLIR